MSTTNKRLYRIQSGSVLGGVCTGLGKYFNFDPILIRLLWVLFFFMSAGTAFIVYIILWIVLPNEKTEGSYEEEETEENTSGKHTDYVFAIFLVLLGTVFLFNTTGIVPWDVWSVLWKFWPLLIIFAGLNLIVQDSKIFKLLVALFSALAFILVFLWAWGSVDKTREINIPFVDSIIEISEEQQIEEVGYVLTETYPNLISKDININMGVGELDIDTNQETEHLELNAKYTSIFSSPEMQKELEEDNLTIDIEIGEAKKASFFNFNVNKSPKYSLSLGQGAIPTNLALELGAGRSKLDLINYNIRDLYLEVGAGQLDAKLSELPINKLEMEVGAGQMKLEIDETVTFNEKIDVKVGAGQLTITIPENYGYKISGNVGVGAMNLRDETISGLGKEVTDLKSENYDAADYTLELNADIGVGQLIIK